MYVYVIRGTWVVEVEPCILIFLHLSVFLKEQVQREVLQQYEGPL